MIQSPRPLKNACEHADVIIFATPVNTTVAMMQQAVNWKLKDDVIMTDTGSTKGPIMDAAKHCLKSGITFIGGHPMAGSHKSGVTAAKEHLFENAYYILTPDSQTDSAKVERSAFYLVQRKGKLSVLDSEEHDRMTAIVSHFPHLIASSLVGRLSATTRRATVC